MSRWIQMAATVICLVAPAVSAQAQTVRSQVPVVTRLVQIYSENERRLADAINRRDSGEIDRLVASDFELRSAADIGTPVPRADWLAQSLSKPPSELTIGQMAVHDYGDVRIVSFLMTRTGAPAIAVVDVWLQSGAASVLKVRYTALQAQGAGRPSGEISQPPIEKRY